MRREADGNGCGALKDRKEDEGKIREGVSYDKKDQRVPDRTGCQRG